MIRLILLVVSIVFTLGTQAHVGGHGTPTQAWKLSNGEIIHASFIKYEDGKVFLEGDENAVLTYDLAVFSEDDQGKVGDKFTFLEAANYTESSSYSKLFSTFVKTLFLLGLAFILFSLFRRSKREIPLALGFTAFASALILLACNTNQSASGNMEVLSTKVPANDFTFLNSIFGAFDEVTTRHDEKYYYIESNGIPDHEMMTGITNWQQQVPIPHDYTKSNAWAIPLQPQIAAHPLSSKDNFMKGAIAIGVNGIPIFNPLNNRGEDANAIGELDRWGGHCGRADDYHYHLPPVHLQAKVGEGKPIAYALDGFPVYGETTQPLDECLGRFTADSSYQYHAVKEYPYLIAAMRGKVDINPRTSAPENEIAPQAHTKGVRPDLRPLRGAEITSFEKTSPTYYELTYTIDGEDYAIAYRWDETGAYMFEFLDPNGEQRVETYQRD